MKAICLHARGGPEAFVYEEAPQPHPEEGEVLVRVHAAAVTPTELAWVPTWTSLAKGLWAGKLGIALPVLSCFHKR